MLEAHSALDEESVGVFPVFLVVDFVGGFEDGAGVDPVVEAEGIALLESAVGGIAGDIEAVVAEDEFQVFDGLVIDERGTIGDLRIAGIAVGVEA